MAAKSHPYKEQHDAIQKWFCRATGLKAVWRNSKTDHGRNPPSATLRRTRIRSLGVDEVRRTTVTKGSPPADFVQSEIVGQRQILVTLRIRSRDHNLTEAAYGLMEAARSSLKAAWALEILRAGCVSVVESGDVVEIEEKFQGRIESVALLDLTFGTVLRVTDPRNEATTIEEVEISSNLQPMADSLQLDEEKIP